MPTNGKLDPDPALVRKLAKLLEETGLNEIEYAEGDKRIKVSAGATPGVPVVAATQAGPAAAPAENSAEPAKGTPVTAPMVGTAYLSSEPGKPAFVKKGDAVKQGDTLLIIEAMKVMNPIKAPAGGTIADILVADGKPVEFGETLIVIA